MSSGEPRVTDEQLADMRARAAEARHDAREEGRPYMGYSDLYDRHVHALLGEVARLRADVPRYSENFDNLSRHYHEARERWKEKMERMTAENAALRAEVARLTPKRSPRRGNNSFPSFFDPDDDYRDC